MQATAAATGTALDDKEEKIRAEARSLTKELFAKLDALSHFQYAPKPVVEDLSVKADVPALAMEEVAPQVRSSCVCCQRSSLVREAQGSGRYAYNHFRSRQASSTCSMKPIGTVHLQ